MGGNPILQAEVSPAKDAKAVTPNSNNDIPAGCRALYIGTSGNVKVTMKNGTVVTFNNVQDGTVLPVMVTRVHAISPGASDIVALY